MYMYSYMYSWCAKFYSAVQTDALNPAATDEHGLPPRTH